MKKNKQLKSKKLVVNKKTIVRLNPIHLNSVKGGTSLACTDGIACVNGGTNQSCPPDSGIKVIESMLDCQ